MMLLTLAATACLAVAPHSDRIFARDLVPKFPAMRQVPPDAVISFAPVPGATRTFTVRELRHIADLYSLRNWPVDDICFERPLHPLDPEALLSAMRWRYTDGLIELVDYSRQLVPEGEIDFPPVGLKPAAEGDVGIWSGSVRYGLNQRFPIWAKIKTYYLVTKTFAKVDIPEGRLIEPEMIMPQMVKTFPSQAGVVAKPDYVVGKVARFPIRAGSEVHVGALEPPKDIMRGDPIKVVITSGGAQLEFDGIAEGSGSAGARIQVRNPTTNKLFPARVEGKGKAAVDIPAAKGMQ